MYIFYDITYYIAIGIIPLILTIENLNKACPDHLGDWYFTGDYPTLGGNKVANRSFMNYCDGISKRAY